MFFKWLSRLGLGECRIGAILSAAGDVEKLHLLGLVGILFLLYFAFSSRGLISKKKKRKKIYGVLLQYYGKKRKSKKFHFGLAQCSY